ncbi:MAG: hypothetical protein WBV53_04100 [Solirubrobacterales bacterium]
MPTNSDKLKGARRGLIAAVFALAALLVASSMALAAPDDLKGGSVVVQLHGSHGLKLKPRSLTLQITGGAIDPLDGSGTAQVSGAFKAKHKGKVKRKAKGKAKVRLLSLTFGANGAPGTILAKVGKDFVSGFGTLRGGTVTRDGYGARIENVAISLAGRGAKALNRAFRPRHRKGARKSARGRVKAGRPLGTIVSMTTEPLAVHVVPDTGEMALHTDAMGAFVSKLPNHCINPLPGGSPPGVAPIAPATAGGLLGTDYTFPVTGGDIAPDFSAGELFTAGGQTITKNSTAFLTPDACASSAPATGSELKSTDLSVAFSQSQLRSLATLPIGTTLPRAPLATIDFSTATRSIDPGTNTVTLTGATVRLADLAAPLLNQNFPTESGNAGDDFATGDLIGTVDITGVKLR